MSHDLPRKLSGRIPWSSQSSRRGYGLPVFERSNYTCLYCKRDLKSTYENWLNISIEHIIPHSTLKVWGADFDIWIDDLSNTGACCRACNGFLTVFKLSSEAPKSLEEFYDLRDKVYLQKKELALRRHKVERTWFEKHVKKLKD